MLFISTTQHAERQRERKYKIETEGNVTESIDDNLGTKIFFLIAALQVIDV